GMVGRRIDAARSWGYGRGPVQTAVRGFQDFWYHRGKGVPRECDPIQDPVGREREPYIPSDQELPAGARRQRNGNPLPRLASVEGSLGDEVLEGPLDPRRHDVVGTDWVHRDERLLSFVDRPNPTCKSIVARPHGIGP